MSDSSDHGAVHPQASQMPGGPGQEPSDDLLQRYEIWRDGADPQAPVPAEFAELAAGSALLRETINQEVEALPDAAFAAMWSRVQGEIEAAQESTWSKIWNRWSRSWRLPVTAMAGVGAVALVWVVVQPKPDAGTEMRSAMIPEASMPSAAESAAASAKAPAAGTTQGQRDWGSTSTLAFAPEMDPPQIEKIDFVQGGGRIDRIEHARGTTTVVWIEAPLNPRVKKAMNL